MSRVKLKYLLIFLTPVISQLFIFSTFDLGVDEAHYMLYARHLALSYFDHPPLIGWLHFIFNSFLGENLFSARFPAMLVGLFSSWQLFLLLKEEGFSEKTALLATLSMSFCLQFFILHLFFLPETLCLIFVWPLMRTTTAVARLPKVKKWLWLGLWLGLMGLSKYIAILFLVPVAVVILKERKLTIFKSRGVYFAIVLSLLIVSPVFIWNALNHWASLKYQMGHVLGESENWKHFLQATLAQIGLYGPFLWPFAVIGFYDLSKKKSLNAQFMFWTCFTFAVFFIYSAWTSTMLPHWSAIFYLFALPWGFATILKRKPLLAKIPLALNIAVISIAAVLLLTGLAFQIPMAFRDVTGWPTLMNILSSKLEEGGASNDTIAVTNWTYASRALYYSKNLEAKVFILDEHKGQFDFWNSNPPWGKNLWIVQFSYDEKDLKDLLRCNEWSQKELLPAFARGYLQYDFILQKCTNAQPK